MGTQAPGGQALSTDWDGYYRGRFFLSAYTRRYCIRAVVRNIRRYGPELGPESTIVEIGGANSCFYDRIRAEVGFREYHVFDSNRYGLDLLAARRPGAPGLFLHHEDVLNARSGIAAGLVFSSGLIEHFGREGTRQAILAHLDMVRAGGLLLLTFPTPTALYRAARGLAEATGQWKFPDERPLESEEVKLAIGGRAAVEHEEMLWPMILTQTLLVARKR